MSGHSKWSKVKHQKAVTDSVKGKLFTKASRAISIAIKEGGGVVDPEKNFRLRMAIDQAKAVNMPKDTIERAIAKGAGEGVGTIEEIIYEAYGPSGVALVIETATDNRQRTVAEVKNTLLNNGGTLADPGAVAYMFERRGVIVVTKQEGMSTEALFDRIVELGALDIVEHEGEYEVFTPYDRLAAIRDGLTESGYAVETAQLIMHPTTSIPASADTLETLERLEEKLTDLDDVQRIYTNAEGSDAS